jgi:hypothetical protein
MLAQYVAIVNPLVSDLEQRLRTTRAGPGQASSEAVLSVINNVTSALKVMAAAGAAGMGPLVSATCPLPTWPTHESVDKPG